MTDDEPQRLSDESAGDADAPADDAASTSSSASTTLADAAATATVPKLTRWDRPRRPRDWRWFIDRTGRWLIVLGLLIFGFVAYQLWGTGIQTARSQNALDDQFNEYLDDAGIVPDTIAPPTTTPPTTSSTPESTTTTTVPEPVVQDYSDVTPGAGIAQLKIPRIGVDFKVVAGVSAEDLAKGPGHFPNTPAPGQLGNAVVAGHRTSHAEPFFDLDRLEVGDEIQIFTRLGDAYLYLVTGSEVVDPSDYHVVTDSDPDLATLTLITCTPKYSSSQRLVIHAELDVSRSSPVGRGEPFYGQDIDSEVDTTLPGEDTLPPVETTPTDDTEPSATTNPSPTTAAPSTTAASRGGTNGFTIDEAFSQGWFDDSRAWPHVFAWAGLLGVIWSLSYGLAKRARRLWLAFVVGTIPTVIALYFFYENVNRLLPPAI